MNNSVIIIGGNDPEINGMLAEVFAQQAKLDASSKFHPGDRVRITANQFELIEVLEGHTRSQVDAYLISRELMESVGEVVSASELSDEHSDRSIYYAVEYSIYGVNQYYVLPEHFLGLE